MKSARNLLELRLREYKTKIKTLVNKIKETLGIVNPVGEKLRVIVQRNERKTGSKSGILSENDFLLIQSRISSQLDKACDLISSRLILLEKSLAFGKRSITFRPHENLCVLRGIIDLFV